ncbi:hypothetical protein A8B78_04810 [Jannaschia sp. EhC01]|nr:hypothetical protein A8B78_04810 [Jannaschia sp. EhC01]
MAVTNEEEFRAWLEEQTQETCTAIAHRAAMRVLPFAMDLEGFAGADFLALAVFRAMVTSGVGTLGPTPGSAAGLRKAANTAGAAVNSAARSAVNSADCARSAAYSAYSAASSVARPANSAYYAVGSLAYSADSARSAVQLANFVRLAAYEDAELNSVSWMQIDNPVPEELLEATVAFLASGRSALDAGGPWAFWAEWYARAMAGDPLNWKLQEQIALIPNEIWEAGPEAVAEAIAEIEAQFELRERIAEFEAGRVVSEEARLGIGGNSPPEEIDDPVVAEQVGVIWDSVAGLKDEVEADEPDVEHVAKLIERLGAALKAVLAWCGRKCDLAVNTAIIVTVSSAASNQTPLVLAKAEAILKAAQTWLPFLAP